ncbi:heavy metal-responsive transcriptional regulator [Saccharomonospora saliphila]|uniref:heavy metal-responsive transcriptional regulator n=1 Tax=Saccharomonospora saliphila TaxID=369829 RepID=UPI00036C1F94|nr:heavy metal-responsive transcriptional regulator [Saccharomonospora saliphila]
MSTVGGEHAGMTVAVLARRAGVSTDSVRYYERVGLLPEPPRTRSGYRHYDDDAIDRIRFIQGAQRLGLRLREISDLLSIRDTGRCPCGDAAVLLRDRMGEVDQEIDRLMKLRGQLAEMVEQLPSTDCPNPEPGVWRPPAPARG